MFKSLRAPEKLYALSMWALSLVFAGFLIGLGGRIVDDLPRLDRVPQQADFADRAGLQRIDAALDALAAEQRERADRRSRLQLAQDSAAKDRSTAEAAHRSWLATRSATADPAQDPELLARTRRLDELREAQRRTQAALEALDAEQLDGHRRGDALRRERNGLIEAAQPAWQRAVFLQELRVFGARLALTLPLLGLAAWLLLRKRHSDHWPLLRGVVIFAGFTFFFELLPHLPSYGGYVRSLVGVLLTALAGHHAIRAMRRFLARRQQAAAQSEVQRRRALGYDAALKKLAAGVCPDCERPLLTATGLPWSAAGRPPGDPQTQHCGHCGLKLFDRCPVCATRKSALMRHCPGCGIGAEAPAEAGTAAGAAV